VTRMDQFHPDTERATELQALVDGRLNDPFGVLGPHQTARGRVVRAFLPGALGVDARGAADGSLLAPLTPSAAHQGIFSGLVPGEGRYLLCIRWPDGVQETEDPYAFGPLLGELDLHLFSEGSHWELPHRFGANLTVIDGVEGVVFAVWAPNARRVSVVGYFNSWDGRRHIMRLRHSAGVWELFIPRLPAGEVYNYEIIGPQGELLPLRADPLARATERPPRTGSVVAKPWNFRWSDAEWMAKRGRIQAADAPISIYEVHPASWKRPEGDPGGTLSWRDLAERLIPYASGLGFTHIEFMPIMEHPFGGSWGYQPIAQFAPSARFGEPEGFAHFVDLCHRANLGVILDWVPAHFPTDPHGLGRFDGSALYEHVDPREGIHRDWDTLIYNFGRREVQCFLIASALYWLSEFHVDGLRVDAVASMLYRDYSREPGDWIPNRFGGRENLEAVGFLRRLNTLIGERSPGAITIAEESTAWPGVSARVAQGGLGFSYKWNMGWMHDTLSYLSRDPVHRPWHHNDMTFGLLYAFSERFILPLSHDEVVHGKGSLYQKAPGDDWQKLANLRAYFGFMWTHPGKKLLFMGGEFAQKHEWNHDGEIAWYLLQDSSHSGVQRLVRDLNWFYAHEPALHCDAEPQGFRWITAEDASQSVFAYEREAAGAKPIVTVINMTPVPRQAHRIGVSVPGRWQEAINTDSVFYGGSNVGNSGSLETQPVPAHGRNQSLLLTLPPLAALVLQLQS